MDVSEWAADREQMGFVVPVRHPRRRCFERQANRELKDLRKHSVASPTHNPAEAGLIVRKPVFDTPGGGEALTVYLRSSAKSSDKATAFDINLRCVSAMKECTELCQLAPSAWKSYSAIFRSNGWYVDQLACTDR